MKGIIYILLGIITGLVLTCFCLNRKVKTLSTVKTTDTLELRDTMIDTLIYKNPEFIFTQKIRTDSVRIMENDSNSIQIISDSVVEIPITQNIYQDSTYTAYVSGYNPKLDSIEVYPSQVTTTKIITQERATSRRFGFTVGPSVGYDVINRSPSVGMSVVYGIRF